MNTKSTGTKSRKLATAQFILFSLFGLWAFFINVEINGVSTIPIQHLKILIQNLLGPAVPYFVMAVVLIGAVVPFVKKTYNRSPRDIIFTVLKCLGAVIAVMAVFNIGPALLLQPDYIPFLFKTVITSIALLIPVLGFFFVALLNYGLAEFLGEFLRKFMMKIWKTPGESAVDAIVSFASTYTLAVVVTDSFYKKGVYNARQSVIIATGFSTVAISFLVVIANTLDLMEYWHLYFFTALFVTFAVTAITARLYPINKIPETYWDKPAQKVELPDKNVFQRAFEQGVDAAQNAPSYGSLLKEYYIGDACFMMCSVCASILSIGLIGLLIADFTPVFDIVGYIFYPITRLLQLPEAMLAAKAAAVEIAEMFLPCALVSSASLITKFTLGVTSVTAVLFFSASIPSLLGTDIPVKMKDIIIIWIERTIFSLILAAAIGWIFLPV